MNKILYKTFVRLTLLSLLSLVLYFITYAPITAFMAEFEFLWVALTLYSILFMSVFAYLMIWFTYVRTGQGEKQLWIDYPEEHKGIANDLRVVFKQEKITVFMICAINMACWLLLSIDKLIFGKRTITAIFLIYAPLNIVGIVLPEWLNSVLGYIVGSLAVSAFYILELVLLRKKWHKKYKK